jgi:thiol-disulfide isomerase/thioredoxin
MSDPDRSLSRRQVAGLFGGVAAVAALAGAGLAWRRHGQAGLAGPDALVSAADAAAAPPAASPTGAAAQPPARLATLDGRVLTPADWQGRPLVLNFWAPWCGPCVKEMPELDRFSRAQAGPGGARALVVGLAVDEEAAVRKFLQAHPVGFPISVIGVSGLATARALANDANVALPFTAVWTAGGDLAHRKFGATNGDELAGWLGTTR